LILYGIDLLFNHNPDSRYLPHNVTYSAAIVKNANTKPINLSKPVGTGASMVYSGGGNRRGNMSAIANNINNTISLIGTFAGSFQLSIYNENYWLGRNLKYYSQEVSKTTHNQFTGSASEASEVAKLFRLIGKYTFWLSSGYSGLKIGDGLINNKPKQAFFSTMNLIQSTIAYKGGLVGMFISTPYLLIDNTVGMENEWEYSTNLQIEKAERVSRGDYSLFFYPRFGQSVR